MIEEWKDIIWYEGLYQVSNLGRVKSIRLWKEVVKKISKNREYWVASFPKNWIKKVTQIHRIVAIHFIPNPLNLPLVCHKDETLDEKWMLYNGKDNLFWGTHKDNSDDKWRKWRWYTMFQVNHPCKGKFWKDHPASRKVNQYTLDWKFIRTWDSMIDVERNIWVPFSWVSKCCIWKYKKSWWFIWKFQNNGTN